MYYNEKQILQPTYIANYHWQEFLLTYSVKSLFASQDSYHLVCFVSNLFDCEALAFGFFACNKYCHSTIDFLQ